MLRQIAKRIHDQAVLRQADGTRFGNRERGSDRHERNRFYVDAQTGVMYREGNPDSPLLPDRRYEVSMVRMNAESQLADPPLRNRPTRG